MRIINLPSNARQFDLFSGFGEPRRQFRVGVVDTVSGPAAVAVQQRRQPAVGGRRSQTRRPGLLGNNAFQPLASTPPGMPGTHTPNILVGGMSTGISPQYYHVLSDIADQYWLPSVRSASSRCGDGCSPPTPTPFGGSSPQP